MDPKATLDFAEWSLKDARAAKGSDEESYRDNIEEANDYLKAYIDWRLKGGFEPENGDERYRTMLAELLEIISDG